MKTPTIFQRAHRAAIIFSGCLALGLSLTSAAADTAGIWYFLRTNGVPQSPSTLAKGASGALWIASESPNEKGVWRWPLTGDLVHVTGDARENDLGRSSLMEVKPPLAGLDVNFAVDDAAGNTWYATENGGVRVQKADQSWVAFSTTEPAPRQLANNVIRRLRVLGSGETVLIGPMGAYVVNTSFEITQQFTGIVYNNDMINDVLRDSQGRWWVLDNRGPRRGGSLLLAAHVTTLYPGLPNVPENESPANRIEEDANGNIWMIVKGYGTAAWYCLTAADVWEKYTHVQAGGTSVAATELAVHPNGDVWFGRFYGNGLTRFRRGSGWTSVTLASLGIESYLVNGLALIGNKLWFSTAYNPGVPGGGTGVHYLTLDGNGDRTGQQLHTYLGTTTTLPSNRCRAVAADKSGNVWFGSYGTPSLSRRKADGSWEIWQDTAGAGATTFPINFGIVAIGVDSANIVYFASYNTPPFAYNATTQEWLSLPAAGSTGYTYGLFIDHEDNKWFYGADGAFKLSADNATWTAYNTSGPGTGLPQNYVDYGMRVDSRGNAWFGTRGGLAMLSAGGQWKYFTGGTAGFPGGMGYKVILDDAGEVWTPTGWKYDDALSVWSQPVDKTLFENRNLRFPNGSVFMGPDRSRAQGVVLDRTGAPPLIASDEDLMTLGLDGTVYQGQWAFSSDLGVMAFEPPADALSIAPELRNHAAGPSSGHEIAVTATRGWKATTPAGWIYLENGGSGAGDGKIRYTLLANTNALEEARTGTITVSSADGITRTFTVTQDGRALVAAGERLSNASFDTAGGVGWQIAPEASAPTLFATPGAADLHLTGFTGKLIWQPLSIPNAGGMAFRVGATLNQVSSPQGRTVAVYLDYLDGAGVPQRLLALNPENQDIQPVPMATYFENQITLPMDAQTVTGFSVDRNGAGDISAEEFTLTALGHAIPVVSIDQVAGIGVHPSLPLTGNYVVMNDLRAEQTAWQDDGAGFRPVGGLLGSPFPFSGSFDGQNHRITGLTVNRPAMEPVGLFRAVAGRGLVRRVALVGGRMTGLNAVGALVGMSDHGQVQDCSSSAVIRGFGNVGGLVGDNHSGQVERCAALGAVQGLDAGGAAASACGGVVGFNMGLLRDVYANGALLVANHHSAGGVAGSNVGQGVLQRAYASGVATVTDTSSVGGVVGDAMDAAAVQACFWDTEMSGLATSDGGTGRTTAQMKMQATFTAAGWDLAAIWNVRETLSYPFLRTLEEQLAPPLEISQDPVNVAGVVGGSVEFTAEVAGGLAPLTLRWQRDGADLTEGGRYTGVNDTTLTLAALTMADHGSVFRLKATDARGAEVFTEEAELSVSGPPLATTLTAPYVAAKRATVAGEARAQGQTTTVWFRWGTSPTNLSRFGDAQPNQATGTSVTAVSCLLVELTPNTTYYYRIVTQNAAGTAEGDVLNFKTTALTPPVVTTSSPINVTPTSATLRGRIHPRNVPTLAVFEHGLTKTYQWSLPGMPHMVSGNAETEVTAELTGLQPHTRYHYRLAGYGDSGQALGADVSFVTTNRSPVALIDSFAVCPQSVVLLDVLGNDTDDDGDALLITSFTQPPATVGRLTRSGTSLVLTTGASVAVGGGSFNYTVSDGFGGTATATVTLTASAATLNPAVKDLPSAAAAYSVQVTSTGSWSVKENVSWISTPNPSGQGSGPVTLQVQANTGKTARIGTVLIGGQTHTVTQAGVVAPGLTVPMTIPTGIVGGQYHLVIPTTNPPVTYKGIHLPKGLSIEQSTGTLMGRPLESGTTLVTVEARNAATGTPATVSFSITVQPYPLAGAGKFSCLIERGTSGWLEHGGFLTFDGGSTGSLSGKLVLRDKVFSFRSQLEVPLSGNLTAAFPVKLSKTETVQVSVALEIPDRDLASAEVSGSVAMLPLGGETVDLAGWRVATEGTAFAGRYTAVMEAPTTGNPDPEGSGYFTLVAQANGLVSWSGKVADGTLCTGVSALWPTGEAPIYKSLLQGKASVLGGARLILPMAPGLRQVAGGLNWLKRLPVGLVHPWLGPVDCALRGGEYLPPTSGTVVLGLPSVAVGQVNARVEFTGGNIESAQWYDELAQRCRITTTHKAVFSTSRTVNPALVKITSINPKTGVFKGAMVLKDTQPPLVSRSVTFEGTLITGEQAGEGFFILPQLPMPPQTSVSKTMRNSGKVVVLPATGLGP